MLRCANPAAAETLIDRLEKMADLSADSWPRALSRLPLAGFQGWAAMWPEVPLQRFFSPDSASVRNFQSFAQSLMTQFPILARSRDVHFAGTFHDRFHAEMDVSFHTDALGAAALTARLNEWLANRKRSGHARVGASGDTVELVKFEVRYGED
jgi:hypothetical protein